MNGRCPRCGVRVVRGVLTCPRCETPLEWTPVWPVGVVLAGAAAMLASVFLSWAHETIRVPIEGGPRQYIAFDQGIDSGLALVIFVSAALALGAMLGPRRSRLLSAFGGAVGLAVGIASLDPWTVRLASEDSTWTSGPGVFVAIAGGFAVIVGALAAKPTSVRAVGGYELGTAMTAEPGDGVRYRYRLWAFELIPPMLLAVRGYQQLVAAGIALIAFAAIVGGDLGPLLGAIGVALLIAAVLTPFARGVHRPPVIVDVTPRGLSIEGNAVHFDIPWEQITRVRRVARFYVFRTRVLGSVMLPVRAVTAETRDRFEALLARRHEPAEVEAPGAQPLPTVPEALDGEPIFTAAYRFGRLDWLRLSLELRLRAIAVIELSSLVFIAVGLFFAFATAGDLRGWIAAGSLAEPLIVLGVILAAVPLVPLVIVMLLPRRASHFNKPIHLRLYSTQIAMTIDGSDSIATWRAFSDATESRSFFRLRQVSPRREVLIPKAGLTIDQQAVVREVLRRQQLLWSVAPDGDVARGPS